LSALDGSLKCVLQSVETLVFKWMFS